MGHHPLYFVFLKKLLTVNRFTTAIFEYGLQRYNATNHKHANKQPGTNSVKLFSNP